MVFTPPAKESKKPPVDAVADFLAEFETGEKLPDNEVGLEANELNESYFNANISAECIGKEEEHQKWQVEDRLVSLQEGRIIGVFDGLDSSASNDGAGHKIYQNHGYKASEVAARSFTESYKNAKIAKTKEEAEKAMLDAMILANSRVRVEKLSKSEDKGIGTTFVGAEVWRDKKTGEAMLTVGNAGDSIAFLYRDGKLERISTEHSMVNFLNKQHGLAINDQNNDTFEMTLREYVSTSNVTLTESLSRVLSAPARKDAVTGKVITIGETTVGNLRNLTVGGLGNRDIKAEDKLSDLEMSIKTIDLRKGDKILMCSDGLSDSTSDTSIEQIIKDYESMGADTVRQALIEKGFEAQTNATNMRANKKDDVTVAWVEFNGFEDVTEIELDEDKSRELSVA